MIYFRFDGKNLGNEVKDEKIVLHTSKSSAQQQKNNRVKKNLAEKILANWICDKQLELKTHKSKICL